MLRMHLAEVLSRVLASQRRHGNSRLVGADFGGRGLQLGIRQGDWSTIREFIYEGRGG